MNLIHGRHVFRVAGFNMVLSDDGAAAYLENGVGTTFPLVVDEVVSKQLFKAHTAELLPAGDYKLVVKSRAGDAAGPLQTSFRRVKYLHVEDPEPEPIAESSDGVVKVRVERRRGEGHGLQSADGSVRRFGHRDGLGSQLRQRDRHRRERGACRPSGRSRQHRHHHGALRRVYLDDAARG